MMRLAKSFSKINMLQSGGYVNFVWIVKVEYPNLRRLETLDLFPDKILEKKWSKVSQMVPEKSIQNNRNLEN